MNLNEKIQKRAGLVSQMRALLDKAKAENNRELTADETTSYEKMEKDVDQLGSEIQAEQNKSTRSNRLADLEGKLRSERDSAYRSGDGQDDGRARNARRRMPEGYRDAFFDGFVRRGKNGMEPKHFNAMSGVTDGDGGYLVPEEFETSVIVQLEEMDPVRAAANQISTTSDRHIPIEVSKAAFSRIGESGAYPETKPGFGRVTLGAYKAGGVIKVPEELMQDTFLDLEAYLRNAAVRAINDLDEVDFAVGTGAAGPLGLFATTEVGGVSIQGFQGAVSASAAITGDDLIETFHKLGRSYRTRASWVTSDTMVKLIRKLKGEDNQYLWMPGLAAGAPDTILGRPVLVSEGAPAPAVSGKSIMLGDLKDYTIVNRLGMSMQRLNELYAGNGQIGFRTTYRNDARITSPWSFVYFQHGAAA